MTRARNAEIYRRHAAGDRVDELARDYGVSSVRVRQIIERETTREERLEAQRAAAVRRIARLVDARDELNQRIRTARRGLVEVDEELQSSRIDRLLGIVG